MALREPWNRAPVRDGVGSGGTRADDIIQTEGRVVRRSTEPNPRTKGARSHSPSMPNGADLRFMKVWGWRFALIAGIALVFEPLLVIFGWAVFGAAGLAVAVPVLNITVMVAIWSLQSQLDAVELAIRGVRDESDYSEEVKAGMRRIRGVK